jgi:putative flippase GtrA
MEAAANAKNDASMLNRLLKDRHTQRLFITYCAIGGSVQVLDLAVFQTLIVLKMPPLAAVTAGGAAAMFAHFSLNKWANFRNFDRPTVRQFRTYLATTAVWWIVTAVIVETFIALHFAPIVGKLVAVAVNLPLNFLAQRYLTFGPGIRARLRSLLSRG